MLVLHFLCVAALLFQADSLNSTAVENSNHTQANETLRLASSVSKQGEILNAPFVVALVFAEQTACTGSILDPAWVLTAAHCIIVPGNPSSISVIAGAQHRHEFLNASTTLDDKADVQKREAKEFYLHPWYWAGRISKYDVALIRLDPFVFNNRINKIGLWTKEWVKAEKKSPHEYGTLSCQAVGWGSLEKGVPSDSMRTANVTVQHGTKACPCHQMYTQRRMVCTAGGAIGGLCPGDSGGPLVCDGLVTGVAHVLYHRKSCRLLQIGQLELKCNSPEVISAWMYVCPMLSFLKDHVPGAPQQPVSCRSIPATIIHKGLIVSMVAASFNQWLIIT